MSFCCRSCTASLSTCLVFVQHRYRLALVAFVCMCAHLPSRWRVARGVKTHQVLRKGSLWCSHEPQALHRGVVKRLQDFALRTFALALEQNARIRMCPG